MCLKYFYRLLSILFVGFALLHSTRIHARADQPNVDRQEIPFERGLDKILLELKAAQTGLCALHVAAHPNGEDGATLAWMRRVGGFEVHTCLVTRGEGRTNRSGSEFGNDLAVLRTREMEAAAKILGTKVWYLNQPDSGYAKSMKEVFASKSTAWNKVQALAQLVRIIRIIQPDILFTSDYGTEHGPGQQQAIETLVREAYEAAADAKKFPSQLTKEGLKPWIISNLYKCSTIAKADSHGLPLDVSKTNSLSGHSPIELAKLARQKHVSWRPSDQILHAEKNLRFMQLVQLPKETRKQKTSILKELIPSINPGINTPISWVTGKSSFDPKSLPNQIFNILLEAQLSEQKLKAPDTKSSIKELTHARRRVLHLSQAAALTLGLRVSLNVSDAMTVPGEKVTLHIQLTNNGSQTVQVSSCKLRTEAGWKTTPVEFSKEKLKPGSTQTASSTLEATKKAFPTFPANRYIFERIETRTPTVCLISVTLPFKHVKDTAAHSLTLALPAASVPLDLAPPVEVFFSPDPVLLFDDPNHQDKDLVLCKSRLTVINHQRKPWTCYAKINENKKIRARMEQNNTFSFSSEEQTLSASFRFMIPVGSFGSSTFKAPTTLWTKTFRLSSPPVANFKRIPITLPTPLNVALIPSHNQSTWNALKLLKNKYEDLQLELLTPALLREKDLSQYHTIILDQYVTQTRSDLLRQKDRLKKYMKQGGHIVCLHQGLDPKISATSISKPGSYKSVLTSLLPFPITLSNKRITNQHAPIKILESDHPLLLRPCKILENGFSDWIVERGISFPEKWDPRYHALLSSHDAGEAPLNGGLLFASVGSGSFVYTSYGWSRQLQAGNRGAYRMLANLISYPKIADQD